MKDIFLPQNEKIKEFIKSSKNLRKAAAVVSPLVFSFIISLAKMPLSTYPFGFALLGAATHDTPIFFGGAILFSLLAGDFTLAFGYASIIIFRFIFSKLTENRFSFSFKDKKEFFSLKDVFLESESISKQL